jgi:hypothetical protein
MEAHNFSGSSQCFRREIHVTVSSNGLEPPISGATCVSKEVGFHLFHETVDIVVWVFVEDYHVTYEHFLQRDEAIFIGNGLNRVFVHTLLS